MSESRRSNLLTVLCIAAITAIAVESSQHPKEKAAAAIAAADKTKKVLIKNVNIFNGTSDELITGKDVVLEGNKIAGIISAGSGGSRYDQVIDGKGGYLTLGLIDARLDGKFRKTFNSSSEIMIQATGTAGEMLALFGKRNPYGKLGVVEAGGMADLLIYSGNPLADVAIAADPEKNLAFIMKDGKIYKNSL